MDSLKQTVREVVAGYARKGLNSQGYLTQGEDGTLFTVVVVSQIKDKHFSDTSLIVRIVGEHIIIERDQNDKPLVEALLQAGIPRKQIILAYAGEPVPESA
ncbi:MAG: hypothetical protein DYG88_02870 [Chloroflexi bacterium CFX4]|nr:hypothetical protein [Chloroflexi bacterium CFX4]MDL1922595.1 XisI protein [Chloroflexi bacterium CFX3]